MKSDVFRYKNEDYFFLSYYGLNAKIYGRGKKRILVEDDRVIFEYSGAHSNMISIR